MSGDARRVDYSRQAGPPKARGEGDGSEIHKQPRAMTLALTRIDRLA